MNHLDETLILKFYQNQLKEIQQLIQCIESSIAQAPDGTIRCEMSKGKYPQYFLKHTEDRSIPQNGRYLKKSEWDLAKKLVQKEYDLNLLKHLKSREQNLIHIIDCIPADNLCLIHSSLPPAKKLLVEPRILSDEEYLRKWYETHTGGRNPFPIQNGFLTERGEIVRSKSEKIIADKLFYKGIPYVYEAELRLSDHKVTYPDFTILNLRTRNTYIHEHLGLMDSADYCKKALLKIELYEEYQIYPWKDLIITMECSLKGLSITEIDALIEHYYI